MDPDNLPQRSHLFLIRLWPGQGADGQAAWCGKVQPVMSGQAHYFSDWSTLAALLATLLPAPPEPESGD